MKSRLCSLVISILFFINYVSPLPPEACFANFRWDDCGKPPVPVMYYWKPGSRCEVGLWRGCLPNLNMFQDEYECVSACVFTVRAMPEDYHNLLNVPEDPNDNQGLMTGPPVETEPVDITDGQKNTTAGQTVGVTVTGDKGKETEAVTSGGGSAGGGGTADAGGTAGVTETKS